MELLLLIVASLCFAVGGLFMKLSNGASRLGPTIAFSLLFLVGALVQAYAMRRADLGVVYIAVLGLEAILAFVFSVALLHDSRSPARIAAIVLIVAGVILLRRT